MALLKGRNNYLCLHKLEGGYPEDEPDALFDMPSSTSRVGEEWCACASGLTSRRPATVTS